MISVQITCPFRYKYPGKPGKDIFFMAGEYYHLDEKKDKDEVKKLLSPSFEFKEYIYINRETIPQDLLKDCGLESVGSFHSNPLEEEYVSTLIEGTRSTYQIEDPGPDYDEAPTKDVEDNKWAMETEAIGRPVKEVEVEQIDSSDLDHEKQEELEESEKQERIKEEKEQGALNTPSYTPDEAREVVAEAETSFKDGEIEERRKELDSLHYTKIQDVAEQYHIEYTKKDDTIAKILEAEFAIHEDIKELEGQYKTDEDLKA